MTENIKTDLPDDRQKILESFDAVADELLNSGIGSETLSAVLEKVRAAKEIALATVEALLKSQAEHEKTKKIANTDGLTKLLNRRHGDETACQLIEDNQGNNRSMVVIFIDLDYFKQVNDTFGHTVGDQVLKSAATIIKKSLREKDELKVMPHEGKEKAMRYGGEEFVVFFNSEIHIDPETKRTTTPEDHALIVAERIRKNFEKTGIKVVFKKTDHKILKTLTKKKIQAIEENENEMSFLLYRTASLGVVVEKIGKNDRREPREIFTSACQKADRALYDAKKGGRNCVGYCTEQGIKLIALVAGVVNFREPKSPNPFIRAANAFKKLVR